MLFYRSRVQAGSVPGRAPAPCLTKTKRGSAWRVVLGWLCVGSLYAGETAAPPALSLAQAQQLALQANADYRITQSQVAAAAAQLKAAHEFPNPIAGFSTGKINTDGRTNATAAGNHFYDRSYDSIVSLSQLIELGKRGPRRTSSEAGLRSAEAQRDDARRLLLQTVSQAYFSALEAREEVGVLTESAASLRKEADIAATRYHAGDIAASDQAQIEITAAQLEMSAVSAHAAARSAVIVLEILLNQSSPRGERVLSDKLEELSGLAENPNLTAGSRPDVIAAEAGVAKAESDLTLQKRGVVPDMTVSVQFEHQPPDQPNTMGVGVSFPLPLWNRNTAAILAAKAARDQMMAQLDKVRVQASADVASARLANEEARLRAETYRRELQPKSASISKTVAYSYAKGGASLVELLAAERNDSDIRLAAVRARADWLAASAALEAALNLSTALTSARPAP